MTAAPSTGATDGEGTGSDGAGPLTLSASQLHRFATCETAWLLDRQHRRPEGGPKPDYFLLGDLVHDCRQAWGQGRPWLPLIHEALAVHEPGWTPDFEIPGWVGKAQRIMYDWVLLNGDAPAEPLMSVELPFNLAIPGGRGARIRGFIDAIRRVPGDDGNPNHDSYRLVEIKTMGRWGRERRVAWSNDTWLYLWAARQLIPNVTGLDFEAISTYDYKPTEPKTKTPETLAAARRADAEKRFRDVPVEWDERHADRMLDDLRRTAARGAQLLARPSLAVRSVGDSCDRCAHQVRCLRPWEEQ